MSRDRFALITGAGGGIGRAAALALAKAGWYVALTGRRPQPLEETAREVAALDCRALVFPCDITGDPQSVKALFAKTGESVWQTFSICSSTMRKRWRSSPFQMEAAFLRTVESRGRRQSDRRVPLRPGLPISSMMKSQTPKGGRIINNGSISAHTPRPNSAALHRDETRHHGLLLKIDRPRRASA